MEEIKELRKMANSLWEMRHKDTFYGISNMFLDIFLCQYYSITLDTVSEWFENLWILQKDNVASYGDIDYSLIKLFEGDIYEKDRKKLSVKTKTVDGKLTVDVSTTDEVVRGDKKHIRVLEVKELSGCGHWLIFVERKQFLDALHDITIHVRMLYDDKDIESYRKKSWQNKYGDVRDNGYVLSASKEHYSKEWCIQNIGDRMFEFEHMARNIGGAVLFDENGNKR